MFVEEEGGKEGVFVLKALFQGTRTPIQRLTFVIKLLVHGVDANHIPQPHWIVTQCYRRPPTVYAGHLQHKSCIRGRRRGDAGVCAHKKL